MSFSFAYSDTFLWESIIINEMLRKFVYFQSVYFNIFIIFTWNAPKVTLFIKDGAVRKWIEISNKSVGKIIEILWSWCEILCNTTFFSWNTTFPTNLFVYHIMSVSPSLLDICLYLNSCVNSSWKWILFFFIAMDFFIFINFKLEGWISNII